LTLPLNKHLLVFILPSVDTAHTFSRLRELVNISRNTLHACFAAASMEDADLPSVAVTGLLPLSTIAEIKMSNSYQFTPKNVKCGVIV
jgi:hypothetical protein